MSATPFIKAGDLLLRLLRLPTLVILVFGYPRHLLCEPTELVDFQWRALGQQPDHLDTYPLFGRSAPTQIYVRAVLKSEIPIRHSKAWIEHPDLILRDGVSGSYSYAGIPPRNLDSEIINLENGASLVWATAFLENDINWAIFQPGDSVDLKLRVWNIEDEATDFNLGKVYLSGPVEGGDPIDNSPPDSISDVVVNQGQTIELPVVGANVPVSFKATDPGFGIAGVSLRYYNHESETSLRFSVRENDLIEAARGDDLYELENWISGNQPPGTYALVSISLTDFASNSTRFEADDLGSSIQKQIEVIRPLADLSNSESQEKQLTQALENPSDGDLPILEEDEVPVLEFITVECTEDVAGGSAEFRIALAIHDADSKLSADSVVRINSPTRATIVDVPVLSGELIAGDEQTGIHLLKVPLESAIEPGSYYFEVTLVNEAGLTVNYGLDVEDQPFPNGFDGFCEVINSGSVDYAPPIPMEFIVTPEIALEGSELDLNVTIRIVDVGTGLASVHLRASTGIEPGVFSRSFFYEEFSPQYLEGSVGSGDLYDGTYEFNLSIPASRVTGDFLSFDLRVTDHAGNFRKYNSRLFDYQSNSGGLPGGSFPFPFHYGRVELVKTVDPESYEAFAYDSQGVFPLSAKKHVRQLDYDFDGDGRTNGEEFEVGTDPADPNDSFKVRVEFDPVLGTKVVFRPYYPDTHSYSLYSVFLGEHRDEEQVLDVSPTASKDETGWGCFTLPLNQGLEDRQLRVEISRNQL